MCSRILVLAAALLTAPPGVNAADLVVWWEEGYYAQEDEAVREIIAAFEQQTGKQVDLALYPQADLYAQIEAALKAGQPPDFAYGQSLFFTGWLSEDRLVDLTDTVGPFSNLFDPDALAWWSYDNAGQRALIALPVGRVTNHVHVWKSLLEQAGSPSRTSRRSGMHSGRSGATKCSRPCAGPQGARTSGGRACHVGRGRRHRG